MKTTESLSIAMLIIFSLVFIACDKDDPIIPNEEELITTVNYTLTPTAGGANVVMSFVDLDGDGGNDPIITGGTLSANQSYTGSLELLNEAVSPSENITLEIEAEDEDHQFFFQSTEEGLDVSYNDLDDNDNPVGLNTSITTGAVSSGAITIILRHEPNKAGEGVVGGDISNAGGETDIQVTFPVDVQ